jgi:hypothetical protein
VRNAIAERKEKFYRLRCSLKLRAQKKRDIRYVTVVCNVMNILKLNYEFDKLNESSDIKVVNRGKVFSGLS